MLCEYICVLCRNADTLEGEYEIYSDMLLVITY